jgi:hypothetical protein
MTPIKASAWALKVLDMSKSALWMHYICDAFWESTLELAVTLAVYRPCHVNLGVILEPPTICIAPSPCR